MLLFFLCVLHYTSHPAQHLAFIFYYIYYIYTYIIHIISYLYITYIIILCRIYFLKYFMISKELYYIHGGYTPGWRGVGAAVVRPTSTSHILKNQITLSSFWCNKLDILGGRPGKNMPGGSGYSRVPITVHLPLLDRYSEYTFR